LPDSVPSEALRILAAFLILFLATLLLASLLAIALSAIFKKLGLGWLNRALGAIFGFARGVLIIGVIVFLAGLTNLPKDTRWQNAMFSAPVEALVLSVLPYMPSYISEHVHYD
jgi:membrane protein required for colicin V production